MPVAPFGSWVSPISPESLASTSEGIDHSRGLVVGDRVYWTRADPSQDGRTTILRARPHTSAPVDVTPSSYVRTTINEYGGGAWTAGVTPDGDEVVVYSAWPGNELRVCGDGLPDRELAPGGDLRYGSLFLDAARRLVLAVREDHRAAGEPVNTIVALDLDTANPDGGRVLASGADFYANPVLSADGRVAFVSWDHPFMPWDSTCVWVTPLDASQDVRLVSSGAAESAVYPAWTDDGTLVYLSDLSGFWNFRAWDGQRSTALHEHPFDFCGAPWTPEPAPYAVIPGAQLRLGCSWLEDGFARVGVLTYEPSMGATLEKLDTPAVEATIAGPGAQSAALFGYADRPVEIVVIDWLAGSVTTVATNGAVDELGACPSIAQPFTFEGPCGPVHAWYYPPTSCDFTAPEGELPPVQVWSHGGPTGFASPAFRVQTQFWTSRGIGIVDVNYSGSTGFGRAYRERLKGNWGIADVADCAGAARALADAGRADPKRLSIRGGSAGGFTTLAALVFTDVFAAGISLYGIGDLEALTTDTHKFESHYLDGLVAPYPERRDVYLARSPRYHLDGLNCPMLILQGLDDRVVLPEQAFAMAQAVQAKGLPVRLITFPGEGHGFRKASSIIETARAALAFLGEVHGFTPAV